MSNLIPPLLSNSPPPPPAIDEEDDDEFGDFAAPNGLSYDCDNFSLPSSPTYLPTKQFETTVPNGILDINSNSKENLKVILEPLELELPKDFYDKRKSVNDEKEEYPDGFDTFQTDVNETNYKLSEKINTNVLEKSVNCENDGELSLDCSKSVVSKGSSELDNSIQSNFFLENNKPSSVHEVNEIGTNCDIQQTSKDENNINTQESSIINTSIYMLNNGSLEDNITSDLTNFSIDDSDSERIFINSHSNKEVKSIVDVKENETKSTVSNNQENDVNILNDSKIEQSSEQDVETRNETNFKEDEMCVITETSISTSETNINSDDTVQDENTELQQITVHDSDFGDFAVIPQNPKYEINDNEDFGDIKPIQEVLNNDSDDEFDDFADFTSSNIPSDSIPTTQESLQDSRGNKEEIDDFGDFASTSFTSDQVIGHNVEACGSATLLLNEKEAFDKSTEIIKEMFPANELLVEDFIEKDFKRNDKIFNQIKNITDTHALLFQWPKSASQNFLLKALNIDSRNILFGHGWNPSMPRFAANLSLTPLEPIKSESTTPAVPSKQNVQSNFSINEPPQLDYTLVESADGLDSISSKEATTKSPDTSEKPLEMPATSTLPISDFQEAIPSEELQIQIDLTKLNIEKKKNNESINKDDFDAFVSYTERTSSENTLGHNVLLRETHISNKFNKPDDGDIVSWLEPTIVTPELVRRERQFVETEEEFDDFQMIVPEEQIQKTTEVLPNLTVKPLERTETKTPSDRVQINARTTHIHNLESVKSEINDDDFGDFTFSLPKETSSTSAKVESKIPPTPVLEPLRPSIVHPPMTSTQISWPDPGISEEEIKRFETLSYSRVQNEALKEKDLSIDNKEFNDKKNLPSVIVTDKVNGYLKENKVVSSARPQPKRSHVDDDEWSDFVSVQSSPVHRVKSEKERSSTPDLPLSVLNLGSIQPAKQPIPVITPNGLVQTKLSSNVSLNFPRMQMYSQAQGQNNFACQPSIISNQFVSQAYGGFSNYQSNPPSRPQVPDKVDDDEWSDFVSHQAKPSIGWSNQPNQLSHWIGATPNIITNPTANLEASNSSDTQRQKQKNPASAMQNKKNNVPNISLPDLDFFAPRNRTNRK